MHLLYGLLIGLLAAPLAGVLGLLAAYGVLWLRGVSEHQGRRGLLAFVFGFVPGALIGFAAVARTTWWLLEGGGGTWRSVIAGTMLALILASLAGAVALVLGVRLAEARRVTNYCGERAAW